MVKRRHIREAVIQFLYFADIEEGPDAVGVQDAFWQIIQESSLRKLTQAKAKAILHIAQGRESRMARLAERSPLALAELKAEKVTNQLSDALKKITTQESALSAALDLLKAANRSKSEDDLVENRLQDVSAASRPLASLRLAWQHALDDAPAWKNKLEPVTATILQLGRVSDRLDAIDSLDSQNSGLHGLEHLRSSQEEILTFRSETELLIHGVLAEKEALDEKLIGIVENYAPERVAPVERAILRLGAYEILHCPDIPRAVSINEAIEIAKKFGSTESSRFINGVLDSIKN